MTSEESEVREDYEASELSEIGNRVRYIQRKVSEIDEHVEDNYNILREILESTSRENGASWYDLYHDENDYQ